MPPPPVADASANARLDAAYGGPLPDASTRAGRAATRARLAALMHENSGPVTAAELGKQTCFALEETLGAIPRAALPVGAPAWATAMNANINNQFANVNNQFANLNRQLANIQARQNNAVAMVGNDPISPVTDAAGNNPPANFPVTYGELVSLTDAQAGPFLAFYALPNAPLATRSLRLRKFLGAK